MLGVSSNKIYLLYLHSCTFFPSFSMLPDDGRFIVYNCFFDFCIINETRVYY